MIIKFTQITANSNDLFAIDQYGRIWRFLINDHSWSLILSPVEDEARYVFKEDCNELS